jgi:hypothetical protein
MKKRTSERPEPTAEVRAQIVPVAHKLSSNPTAGQRSVRKQRTAERPEKRKICIDRHEKPPVFRRSMEVDHKQFVLHTNYDFVADAIKLIHP